MEGRPGKQGGAWRRRGGGTPACMSSDVLLWCLQVVCRKNSLGQDPGQGGGGGVVGVPRKLEEKPFRSVPQEELLEQIQEKAAGRRAREHREHREDFERVRWQRAAT